TIGPTPDDARRTTAAPAPAAARPATRRPKCSASSQQLPGCLIEHHKAATREVCNYRHLHVLWDPFHDAANPRRRLIAVPQHRTRLAQSDRFPGRACIGNAPRPHHPTIGKPTAVAVLIL